MVSWHDVPYKATGVYAILGPNKYVYVGQSANVWGRWATHKFELDCGKHPCKLMQSHWNKCGETAFSYKLIHELPNNRRTLLRFETATMLQYFYHGYMLYNNAVPDVIRLNPQQKGIIAREYAKLLIPGPRKATPTVGKKVRIHSGPHMGRLAKVKHVDLTSGIIKLRLAPSSSSKSKRGTYLSVLLTDFEQ